MKIFCRSEGTEQSMVRKVLIQWVAVGPWACRPFWATDFPARRAGTAGRELQGHRCMCWAAPQPQEPSCTLPTEYMTVIILHQLLQNAASEASETNPAILLQTCNRERSAFIPRYHICALQAMFWEKSVKLALAAISESSTCNGLSPGSPRAWLCARSVYLTLMFLPAFN